MLAQKNRWLAEENAKHYRDIVSSNRLRLAAGDIAQSDLLRIETEGLRAQSDLDMAEAAVEQAQANLAVTLSWPDKSMQFVAQDQWPELQEIGQHLSREALTNMALSSRPDLQADKQRAAQAEKELTLANRLKYPDVTVSGGFARDPSNTVLNSYFVGVNVPIPLFYQDQGESSRAATNLNQMRLAADETELGIRNDVASSLAAWKSADKVVRRFRDELLSHASGVRDRAELAYMKGATGILDFIDAQRSYKAVMLDYFVAVTNLVNAYYDLAKSIGTEPNKDLDERKEMSLKPRP